jgi:hypothetical protein
LISFQAFCALLLEKAEGLGLIVSREGEVEVLLMAFLVKVQVESPCDLY